MDCQANCKALGQVAIDVDIPTRTLCAAMENGKLAYGGWGSMWCSHRATASLLPDLAMSDCLMPSSAGASSTAWRPCPGWEAVLVRADQAVCFVSNVHD